MGLILDFLKGLKKTPPVTSNEESTWGRAVDRDVWTDSPPPHNPDPIDEDSQGVRYFRTSKHFAVKTALNNRDISTLFVSAAGLEPNETGAFFPPQLIYTDPDKGNDEQFDALARQYDEQFEGGFAAIIRSLQQPAMQYGRSIGEISWQKGDDGKFFADFIWSRDPEEFIFSPPNYSPGLYQKQHTYSTYLSGDLKKMKPGRFMYVTFDPLYNNPYGQSILRPLVKIIETWEVVYDSWREGLKKAGYGVWLGEYGPGARGNSTNAKAERDLFTEQMQKIANGVVAVYDEANTIRNESLQFEAKAFLEFHTATLQAVSVLINGSTNSLTPGPYGSYSMAEGTEVREKANYEQADALLLGMAFTYQFNKLFLHFNFANVAALPQLQLIQPERIMPTTPEGQETQDEDEEELIEVETDESDDTDDNE